VNHHRRSAQVWHVFSRDFTVLPAHPPTRSRLRSAHRGDLCVRSIYNEDRIWQTQFPRCCTQNVELFTATSPFANHQPTTVTVWAQNSDHIKIICTHCKKKEKERKKANKIHGRNFMCLVRKHN